MNNKLILIFCATIFFVFTITTSTFALTISKPPGGGASSTSNINSCQSKPTFLGLEPWYQYLTVYTNKSIAVNGKPVCEVCFNVFGNQTSNKNCSKSPVSDITLVLLAIIDDLLRVAGIITIGMVLYSSVTYITSQGQPESTAKARNSIINALIGTAIAMFAIVIVSYIGNKMGG